MVGLVLPVSTPNIVDLPAPDGPNIAVRVLGPRLNETFSRSAFSPISNVTDSALIDVPSIPSILSKPSRVKSRF